MTKTGIDNFLTAAYSKADYELLFYQAKMSHEFFSTIWEMVKERPAKQSWRLLWILDHATEKDNRFILPILDEVYQLVLATENESFIRHGMKLILRCDINEDFAGELLDRCIAWMNDPKSKISSQVLGLEFFYRTTLLYPEMAPELTAIIDDIMERSPSKGYIIQLRKIRSEIA